MRSLIRPAVVLVAPALLALTTIPLTATDAASATPDAMPDVSLDAVMPDAKTPPYPPKFDAGKPPKPDAPGPPKDVGPDAPPKPIPPDPSPLISDAVFVMSVRFNKGEVTVTKVRREKLAAKAAVDRHFGRFAAELYSGPTLVERIRFDFPLINDDSNASDIYAKGLDVTIDVKIPDSDRPNKLEIWDRSTDKRWKLDYPPKP